MGVVGCGRMGVSGCGGVGWDGVRWGGCGRMGVVSRGGMGVVGCGGVGWDGMGCGGIGKRCDKYQKLHVLVAKLFTIYKDCSGSYAISWLECRQTNMFDAKTVILYWTSNITKFTVQQFF